MKIKKIILDENKCRIKVKILIWLDKRCFSLWYRMWGRHFYNCLQAVVKWNRTTGWLFNNARWKTGNYASLFWQ
ncbi:hypothetical protein COS91_06620 [Candidatus Desantisbacteria bacterium CG07_land_8_20_14_0_80_39_15]|uniref:Uncharacterized protein n=1 Tax=Candidatus Desantisbacteria bacterium CG07_land_8_20_14_0_80_39_15 TaxID=1974549 RepID=A0A2M6ZF77_9BACT|nr:MAG: hypothetical protein COS91_06620 [Candidatus Desantisbacteria bacterium CG07_land_8_20_14_0_80_39_15]